MYQYKEIWVKCLIPEFARRIREEATPVDFETVLIDNHYSTQKNAETGKTIKQLLFEYGDISCLGGCDDVIARIDMLKSWERINPATGLPMLQIFKSCERTIWEKKRYEWQASISEKVAERKDSRQRPKDKNGHLMNCLEYLAAHGGKEGLEYFEPEPPPAMQARIEYHKKKAEQERIAEYGGEAESYEDSLQYMYE